MTAEDVSRWKAKRNTGMKLSWSYDDPQLEPDHKYREENRDFIKLANILHSENNKEQLWGEIKLQRNKILRKFLISIFLEIKKTSALEIISAMRKQKRF